MLAATGRSLGGALEDQEEIQAMELERLDPGQSPAAGHGTAGGGRGRVADLHGLVAEGSAAGPGLAAWLSQQAPADLTDRDLPGIAASFRRVASWAQAGELAAVAEIAARSAARDERTGLTEDGRPAAVTRDAAGQVSLGLALSPVSASWWTDLAVTLGWRLRATGDALAAGAIDLSRARVIADATSWLDDDTARRVEARVLPGAGERTYSQLRARTRRAAIAADPEGAEHRREAAERQAKVSLYPDDSHTATLAASGLPVAQAAAAFARLSAMAQAMKAAGAAGGIDLLRSHALIGLLLETMPLIPPPVGAPPDNDPPPDDPPDSGPPPDDPPDSGPPPDDDPPPDNRHRGPGDPGASPPRRRSTGSTGPRSGRPAPGASGPRATGAETSDVGSSDSDPPGAGESDQGAADPSWEPDVPPLTDADAPPDDGFRDTGPPVPEGYVEEGRRGDPLEDDFAFRGTVPPWPSVPAWVPAVPGTNSGLGRPVGGLLDLTLPWATLTGETSDPGALGRIGPVTASQARYLADRFAAGDHAATWRVIVTDEDGRAVSVARMPRLDLAGDPAPGPPLYAAGNAGQPGSQPEAHDPGEAHGPPAARGTAEAHGAPDTRDPEGTHGPGGADVLAQAGSWLARWLSAAGVPTAGLAMTGLVGRVTIVIPASEVASTRGWETDAGGILAAVLVTARRADSRARLMAEADRGVPGGCAHATASQAYRPPPRIREHVIARDVTCRYPFCGQPAWRGDLDHTRPWDQGGLTCSCNLGGLCRSHHILKQHLGWRLIQPAPGIFRWVTPAGRTYTATPDTHLA